MEANERMGGVTDLGSMFYMFYLGTVLCTVVNVASHLHQRLSIDIYLDINSLETELAMYGVAMIRQWR